MGGGGTEEDLYLKHALRPLWPLVGHIEPVRSRRFPGDGTIEGYPVEARTISSG